MNNKKASSYSRLIVFFILAVILILAVSIVADGWQEATAQVNDENSGESADNVSDKADENKDQSNEIPKEPENEPEIPVYLNPLTGRETNEALYNKRHGAFIFNPSAPLYGISYADILIEMPTENGGTKFAALINDFCAIGKLGAITSSRDYILDMIDHFGAFTVSYGKDTGRINTDGSKGFERLDLSLYKGYHYTEYSDLVYTNGNLITGGIDYSGINTVYGGKYLPYSFNSTEDKVVGTRTALSISLPISDSYSTDLIYNKTDGRYTLIKNGVAKNDLLTSKTLAYENCFILYMDSITYDTKEGSELIMDTKSGGSGFYLTEGTVTDILWKINEDGELIFLNTQENTLIVNPGRSYIACLKASKINSTLFS